MEGWRSVTRAKGIVSVTIRTKFTKPVVMREGTVTSARTMAMVDCAIRRIAVKENTNYIDEARGRVAKKTVVGIPGYGSPIKGTATGVAVEYFCDGAGKK